MYLVTEGSGKVNQLGYSPKKKIYTYIHQGKVEWEVEGNRFLLDYFNEIRSNYSSIDEEKIKDNPIWIKYCQSCEEHERVGD